MNLGEVGLFLIGWTNDPKKNSIGWTLDQIFRYIVGSVKFNLQSATHSDTMIEIHELHSKPIDDIYKGGHET